MAAPPSYQATMPKEQEANGGYEKRKGVTLRVKTLRFHYNIMNLPI